MFPQENLREEIYFTFDQPPLPTGWVLLAAGDAGTTGCGAGIAGAVPFEAPGAGCCVAGVAADGEGMVGAVDGGAVGAAGAVPVGCGIAGVVPVGC